MQSEEVGVAHPPSYPLSETLTLAGWLLQPISPSLSLFLPIVSVSAVNFLLSLSADQSVCFLLSSLRVSAFF